MLLAPIKRPNAGNLYCHCLCLWGNCNRSPVSASHVSLLYSATGLHCLYAPQLVAPRRLERSESANTVRTRSSQGCVSHSNSCLRKANARLDPFSCHKTGLRTCGEKMFPKNVKKICTKVYNVLHTRNCSHHSDK